MRADPNQNQYQAAWMMGDRGRNPAAYETAAHNWSRSTANQIAPSMHETQVASNVAMLGANRGLGAMLTHSQGVGFGTAGGVARDGTRHWRDMATQKIGKAKDYGTAASNIGYGDQTANWALGRHFAPNESVGNKMNQTGLRQQFNGGSTNPFLDSMYDSAARKMKENYTDVVNPALNATFGAAGRTGSGIHALASGDAAGELGDSLSDLGANIYGNAYESGQDRALQAGTTAASIGADLYQGDMNRSIDAARIRDQGYNQRAGLASDLYQGDQARAGQEMDRAYGRELERNRMTADNYNSFNDRSLRASEGLMDNALRGAEVKRGAYDSVHNAKARAAEFAPQLQDMDYGNIDRLMQSGNWTQGERQAEINAQRDKWDYNQNKGWSQLMRYINALNGVNPVMTSSGSSWDVSNPFSSGFGD